MDTQEGIFLKELQGVQIRVNNDGKFLAVIAGKLVKKPTLREIEKEIAKHTAGIRVFSFDEFSFREYAFIDLKRDGDFRDSDRRIQKSYHHFYHWNDEIVSRLQEVERQYEETVQRLENETESNVEIIILPRCSECTRYHPMKDLAWNKSGELVCPDCRRSAQPVKTEPGRSSGDLLQAISERVFNMWGSY